MWLICFLYSILGFCLLHEKNVIFPLSDLFVLIAFKYFFICLGFDTIISTIEFIVKNFTV